MAKSDYTKRYLYIIRDVQEHPYISSKELIEHVSRQLVLHDSEATSFSTRTLKRDLQEIRDKLGFAIEWDNRRKGYYIPDNDEANDPEGIARFLESFEILNSLNADNGLSRFVFPEHHHPSGTQHLYPLVQAMKENRLITFNYYKFREQLMTSREVEPYAVKECRGRWYLIGKESGSNIFKTFSLNYIPNLNITPCAFKRNNAIDINRSFRDSFGIINDEKFPVEDITLSFDALDGQYIKTKPFHHSQQIIKDTPDEFTITLRLRVTNDFVMELLSRSRSLRVIQPLNLKARINEIYRQALLRNS